jgi:hypothetical protein
MNVTFKGINYTTYVKIRIQEIKNKITELIARLLGLVVNNIYEQYNLETALQNASKSKHFITIKKTKYLSKQN